MEYVLAGASLLVALGALVVSIWAARASSRSAAAAERAVKAAEDSANSARRSAAASERQAAAAEAALPPPPANVKWQLEHVNRQKYALRNVGVGVATGVQVDAGRARLSGLDLRDGRVSPSASVTFLVSTSLNSGTPTELWVTWDGQSEPVAIPFP